MVQSQRSSYLNIILFAFLMEIQHEVETELLSTCLHELLIFSCVQKIAKSDSFVISIHPSIHMESPGSHWMDFHEIWYLSIGEHLWSYLAQFFLEWEMFQAKVV